MLPGSRLGTFVCVYAPFPASTHIFDNLIIVWPPSRAPRSSISSVQPLIPYDFESGHIWRAIKLIYWSIWSKDAPDFKYSRSKVLRLYPHSQSGAYHNIFIAHSIARFHGFADWSQNPECCGRLISIYSTGRVESSGWSCLLVVVGLFYSKWPLPTRLLPIFHLNWAEWSLFCPSAEVVLRSSACLFHWVFC